MLWLTAPSSGAQSSGEGRREVRGRGRCEEGKSRKEKLEEVKWEAENAEQEKSVEG